MDARELAALVRYLRQQRLVVDYAYAFAVALFIYDYILTLHLEIRFIWFSRWSYTKVLFLLIRYTAFVDTVLILYGQTSADVSVAICRIAYPAGVWLLMLQMTLAETVLAIRTWTVWYRNRKIGYGLAMLVIAATVMQCIFMNTFTRTLTYSDPLYPGFRGCFVMGVNEQFLWQNYALLTFVELVVLTLMAISAFRFYRQGNTSKLSHVIHRDGILFYVYLLTLTVANLILAVHLPADMKPLLSPLEDVLYSVFTVRIVINIRDVGNRDLQVELHTDYHESSPPDEPSPQLSESPRCATHDDCAV